MKNRDDTCYIYLVAHKTPSGIAGPVKVGITTNLDARIAQIQTGNPRPVVVAVYFAAPNRDIASVFERAFHVVKSDHRMTGEWFDMEPIEALYALVANIKSGLSHFLGNEPELLAQSLEQSLVVDGEELISQIEQMAAQRGASA